MNNICVYSNMRLLFKKIKVCDVVRMKADCPICKKAIVLDYNVFSLEQSDKSKHQINCHKCNTDFLVLKVLNPKVRSLTVDIVKEKQEYE